MATGGEDPSGFNPQDYEDFIDTPEDEALVSAVKQMQMEDE